MTDTLAELVLETIGRTPGPLTFTALRSHLPAGIPRRDLVEVVDALVDRGELRKREIGTVHVYELTPPPTDPVFRIVDRDDGRVVALCDRCLWHSDWTNERAGRLLRRIRDHDCRPGEETR